MKRIVLLILAALLLMSCFTAAQSEIKVYVNGDEIVSDVSPLIKEGRTLLPIRAICRAIGAYVSWDGESRTAKAEGYDYTLEMQVGNPEIKLYLDGEDEPLVTECEVAPEIIDGRVFLPLRAICEVLDFDVSWNGEEKTVNIEQRAYLVGQADGGVKIDRSIVKVHGRYAVVRDELCSSQSASGIEVRFEGTSLEVSMNINADAYIHVFVDDKVELSFDYKDDARILLGGGDQRVKVAENLDYGVHTVKILKANEGIFNKITWKNLYTDGKILAPPIAKEKKIQIIGDSITCGSASLNFPENADGSAGGIKYEDAVLSYASWVGRAFDADIEMFAKSGLSMYEIIVDREVPKYESIDPFAGFDDEWNHKEFEPELIIQYNWINEYVGKVKRDGVSTEKIKEIYVEGLEMMRKAHPDAKIMLVSRSDQPEFIKVLNDAIAEFGKTNDISGIRVMTYDHADLVNSGHPHPEGQYNIAKNFISQIEEFMGWKAN